MRYYEDDYAYQRYPQRPPERYMPRMQKERSGCSTWIIAVAALIFGFLLHEFIEIDFSSYLQAQTTPRNNASDTQDAETEPTVYELGERAVFVDRNGKEILALTINSATLTKERSKSNGQDPAQVFVLDYTFENLGSDTDLMISSVNLIVVDEHGNDCEPYSSSPSKMPQATPVGDKCTAQETFMTAEKSEYVTIQYKASFDLKSNVEFRIYLS